MQELAKKGTLLLLSGALFFMTGCTKMTQGNVKTSGEKTESAYTYKPDEDAENLETINVYNDLDAFISLNNQEATELSALDKDSDMSAEEKTQKRNAVITNYVVNLYRLASSRLSADVDSVYTHTDDYMSYIALLQTFVDTMTDESEEFDKKMASGDSSVKEMKSFKAMANIENFYMDLYEYVQTGKFKDNSKSDSETKNNADTKDISKALGDSIRGEKSNDEKSSAKKDAKKAKRKSFSNNSSGED